ncbi:hypothetical protein BDP27DRAFT_1366819 [Rhodocollybia butyracea]|uniref:Uncharacterized protein n=1 Tax=Rhodocollybia butyracea TaxID=206335 RepID=A0A9P5PK94_9AGAR|nr:hypothetical protein BDP27DRAFT_1366819 [Rhodocollybia butyracea]
MFCATFGDSKETEFPATVAVERRYNNGPRRSSIILFGYVEVWLKKNEEKRPALEATVVGLSLKEIHTFNGSNIIPENTVGAHSNGLSQKPSRLVLLQTTFEIQARGVVRFVGEVYGVGEGVLEYEPIVVYETSLHLLSVSTTDERGRRSIAGN